MQTVPHVKVLSVECAELPYVLRMPFRFGATTVREGLQAVIRVRLGLPGKGGEIFGYAAEALAAKWFDKSPALSDADNVQQLRDALRLTAKTYKAAAACSAFDLFANHHAEIEADARAHRLPPLVMSYGPALLDRAILDALCRAHGLSFRQAMQANLAGMHLGALDASLGSFDTSAFLASLKPQTQLDVRHTVGMLDPITEADLPTSGRADDGLPETLQEVIAHYGNRYFKIKLGGDDASDLTRLERIAAVLDARSFPYFVTLDGNEQYTSAEAVAMLWKAMEERPRLARLCASTLLVEQPIARGVVWSQPVQAIARHRPVIIDESDEDVGAFTRARALGYRGVSSKSCKGFYKSLLNLARCHVWNAQAAPGEPPFFLSAEDLTTQPGFSMQQDLALVSLLGISHVERNAHHFVHGFNGKPDAEAREFLAAHPDLYEIGDRSAAPRLRIRDGRVHLASLDAAGFGTSLHPHIKSWVEVVS